MRGLKNAWYLIDTILFATGHKQVAKILSFNTIIISIFMLLKCFPMNLTLYPFIKIPENHFYEFYSEGPKGKIKKVVQYHRIEDSYGIVFNLAFGDWNEVTGRIDDKIKSNNNDREKVLATVAATVIQFTNDHPDAIIFIEGSTLGRTRLYQMGITKFWEEIQEKFEIEGLRDGEWEGFQQNRNYECFLLKRI
jgi:hypothetical protein